MERFAKRVDFASFNPTGASARAIRAMEEVSFRGGNVVGFVQPRDGTRTVLGEVGGMVEERMAKASRGMFSPTR